MLLDHPTGSSDSPRASEASIEVLVEELINLHSTSSSLRQIFKSQLTTQIFVDAYKNFVQKLASAPAIDQWGIGILEKLSHLALALALDESVAGSQKREVSLLSSINCTTN